ncbi:hypothetical protein Syun_001399 [Stephania yunnanensis]|uniref:Ribosomal protein L5 n=1 Tax=Stephania yunnanensis TaxID=152371 RepID=A0AAP0LHR0_9MAGN
MTSHRHQSSYNPPMPSRLDPSPTSKPSTLSESTSKGRRGNRKDKTRGSGQARPKPPSISSHELGNTLGTGAWENLSSTGAPTAATTKMGRRHNRMSFLLLRRARKGPLSQPIFSIEIRENSIQFSMETEFCEFSQELEDHFEIFEHIRGFNVAIVTSANAQDETLPPWSGFLPKDEGETHISRSFDGHKEIVLVATTKAIEQGLALQLVHKHDLLAQFAAIGHYGIKFEAYDDLDSKCRYGFIKASMLPRSHFPRKHAHSALVMDRFRSLFRCHAIVVAWEPLNGGGFHLIAGVWNTSAYKHSAAKRVQDCFIEWAGWDGHRSSLLKGLVDSSYNLFLRGSETLG